MLSKIFGANWKTTLTAFGGTFFAAITWLSSVSYDTSPLSMVVPVKYKPWVQYAAGAATIILWGWNGIRQKDKAVTGGSVAQTLDGSQAAHGTQTLVDITAQTTVATEAANSTPPQPPKP